MEINHHQFDEVEYFTDVAKIRYAIVRLMKKHQLIDQIKPSNGSLNQFHLRTDKNPKAAFAVEFMNDTIPYCLYTPYGSLEINPNEDRYLNLTDALLNQEQKDSFLSDLIKLFHMVPIQPYLTNPLTENMRQPAIYGITKLPWKDQIFDELYHEAPTDADMEGKVDMTEKRHVAQILAQVNKKFKQAGHYELAFSGLKPEKPEMVVTIPPGREM